MEHVQSLFDEQREALASVAPASERRGHLRKLWDAVLHHEQALIEALFADLGKPREEVHLHEIYPLKKEIKYALRHLRGWMAPRPAATSLAMIGTQAYVEANPKGHVLMISPWNFPVILTLRPLVSALAAGNRVIIKPSENTPETSKVLAAIVSQALTQDRAAVVIGGPEVSAFLTTLPFHHICFTGGTDNGKKVMKAAAANLASITLELGGKSPAVVDSTANLSDASRRLAWGKCLNNGQVCIAPDYALVEESVTQDFIQGVKGRFAEMYGPDEVSQLHSKQRSQMVNEYHFQRVVGLIEDALAKGATLAHGGIWDAQTRRIAPTILQNVTLDMKVMNEEIFGPVLPVISWRKSTEIQDIVNACPHPLAMYFFSNRKSQIAKWMQSMPSGTTGINEVVLQVATPNLPFGGIQTSGMGRMGGIDGFEEFSNMRSVLRQTSRFNVLPLTFPPFNRFSLFVARTVQRWL
ncbi:MAG: aldehyde dehydrogenase family protein [Crocinitomicaceae bacterium]|nr:aldehyde dehydrogenase family protein [Crocinitomicaceae bacterium]